MKEKFYPNDSRTASRKTLVCRSTSSLSVCGDINAMCHGKRSEHILIHRKQMHEALQLEIHCSVSLCSIPGLGGARNLLASQSRVNTPGNFRIGDHLGHALCPAPPPLESSDRKPSSLVPSSAWAHGCKRQRIPCQSPADPPDVAVFQFLLRPESAETISRESPVSRARNAATNRLTEHENVGSKFAAHSRTEPRHTYTARLLAPCSAAGSLPASFRAPRIGKPCRSRFECPPAPGGPGQCRCHRPGMGRAPVGCAECTSCRFALYGPLAPVA